MDPLAKIVVPEGMWMAAWEAMRASNGYPHKASQYAEDLRRQSGIAVLAALRWLSENPIVPTSKDIDAIASRMNDVGIEHIQENYCVEWQRRMFLAPEPEIPEAVNDLLISEVPSGTMIHYDEIDRRIIEAYRRGQKSK